MSRVVKRVRSSPKLSIARIAPAAAVDCVGGEVRSQQVGEELPVLGCVEGTRGDGQGAALAGKRDGDLCSVGGGHAGLAGVAAVMTLHRNDVYIVSM